MFVSIQTHLNKGAGVHAGVHACVRVRVRARARAFTCEYSRLKLRCVIDTSSISIQNCEAL